MQDRGREVPIRESMACILRGLLVLSGVLGVMWGCATPRYVEVARGIPRAEIQHKLGPPNYQTTDTEGRTVLIYDSRDLSDVARIEQRSERGPVLLLRLAEKNPAFDRVGPYRLFLKLTFDPNDELLAFEYQTQQRVRNRLLRP